jgi:hypothetical protein
MDPGDTGSNWNLTIPKKAPRAVVVPFSLLLLGLTLGSKGACLVKDGYDAWVGHKQQAREYTVILERRLKRAERQLCILGWDPGGVDGEHTRNADRTCEVERLPLFDK